MSSLSPIGSGGRGSARGGRLLPVVLGAVLAGMVPSPSLRADDDDISEAIQIQGGVYVGSLSGTILPVATYVGLGFPITMAITATTTNFSTYYQIQADVGTFGTPFYQSNAAVPALIEFSNNAGSISGTSSAVIDFTNAPGAYADQISNGALRIIGAPAYYDTATSGSNQSIGGDVSWTHTGAISVAGSGALVSSGSLHGDNGWVASGSLNPAGFRTAQLSGLVAFSYGDQGTNHSHTWPGGNVSVTSSGVIAMSNASSTQITAGISAGTAAGPAPDNGNFPDPVTPPPTVVVTLDNGTITNSADAGIGVMATATGAQFLHGHNGDGDTAFGGAVTVNLLGDQGSSITMTGSTGVGVFAVSEVYSVKDAPKDSKVQAGVVTVNNGTTSATGSSISAGTEDSLFSMGILAISAGQDLFLNPYSSQEVNGHGVGDSGEVIVNNFGSVTTAGKLSAGIAGLSIGGAGVLTTNSGSTADTYLGNSGGANTNGQGDAVAIANAGTITTTGANAYGIVALSTGGGGIINNDIAIIADANGIATNGLVVGNNTSTSSDSHASAGGSIEVTNSGTITTGDGSGTGVASMGIVAQSIGGAGGNAGGDHAALFVGDKGGQGGNGGTTTVTLNAGSLLTTRDENSIGVLAQSIGGGGGNGANAKGLFVAVGGKGGAGGDGGAITIGVSGSLNTLDDYSAGVIAQSIGGGGGHGGTATAVGLGAAFGLGGNGGSGGIGGVVTGTVGSGGVITTLGNNSTAFHLQSIGGGGGTGGASIAESVGAGTGEGVTLDFNMAVGGSGGEGGEGGTVSGVNSGVITTGVVVTGSSNGGPSMDGADSYGMMVQSIGGGGGQGGLATAKSIVLNLSGTEGGTVNPDNPGGAEVDPGPVSDTTSLVISIGANVSDSGSGGKGNNGGAASLQNLGTVTTWGDGSIAMIAQSIGGGGGSGGDSTAAAALSAATGKSLGINLSLGGGGGNGGSGGSVDLANSGASSVIATHGQNAAGLVGQSIGGGGGNATIGNSGTANLHTPVTGSNSADAVAIAFTLGGSGGKGGDAGYTDLINAGSISTAGSGAQGILAQAIGGGGGNASGGAADGSNNKYTIDLGIGGSGGDGGSASGTNAYGQSVMVANSGTILTVGGDAAGIVAQSIGGGGGTGGSADALASVGTVGSLTNLIFSGTTYQSNITVGAAVGGSGGKGGQGGSVLVDQDGFLSTQGFQSYGILAQSISGGGGKGGAATAGANPGLFDGYDGVIQFGAVVAVGGQGGDAHDGGTVTVNIGGQTSTGGYGAHAVVAQSVGGGGGLGADGTADVTSSIGLGTSVNNSSGTMGNGGAVTVNQTANIATVGGDAAGIVAQSISGGGGLGSTGSERHLLVPSMGFGVLPVHLDFTLGVNLHSDDGSDGGLVTINTGTSNLVPAPQITTQGDLSHGIVAQTIGAGGGKASSLFGTDSGAYADFSGAITRVVTGTTEVTSAKGITLGAQDGHGSGSTANVNWGNTVISTGVSGSTGYGAYGVLVQSIGGGGGVATVDTAAANGEIFLGGATTADGVGGHGGAVNFNGSLSDDNGAVTTRGDAAHGMVLQSIGGGGGVAIVGSSREFLGAEPAGLAVNMTLGSRNSFGAGGEVTFSASPDITTHGDNAFGLVAQSIGGGGGIATSQQTGTAALGMQASGTDSYDGGEVDLGVGFGAISTTGNGSHGVVAQSIGGGGGIASPSATEPFTTTTALINSGTALGYGGLVDVKVDGTISTSGAGAHGVLAQVISGGGGLSGSFAGSTGGAHSSGMAGSGTAGDVSVELGANGVISVSGEGSTAIFAQNVSAGTKGMGNAGITISGTVTGGSGSNAYGVWVDGGSTGNTLTINQGGSVSSLSKNAINYTGIHNLAVLNEGVVKGAITLNQDSGLIGTFNNASAGTFYAEGDIRGYVNNDGIFRVGIDDDTAAMATIYDGFGTQIEAAAQIEFDAFSLSEYDRIVFNGDATGEFLGNIRVNFSDSYQARVGDIFYLINPETSLENGFYYFFSTYSIFFQNQLVESVDGSGIEIGGVTFSFSTIFDGNPYADSYALTVTGVPEPGAALLVLMGAGGLFLRRTRRAGRIAETPGP